MTPPGPGSRESGLFLPLVKGRAPFCGLGPGGGKPALGCRRPSAAWPGTEETQQVAAEARSGGLVVRVVPGWFCSYLHPEGCCMTSGGFFPILGLPPTPAKGARGDLWA